MNESLPVFEFKDQIVELVNENQAVIITAETGAGKTTQVPQFLLEAGYNIVITQPRRIAARTVAERVAEEMEIPLGGIVGYRTAYEHLDSPETQCLYCTDGLALVRELMGRGKHDILIIDEVHEWNMNIETLLAWSLNHIKNRPRFRVVMMSATIEAEKLSDYFLSAPIITVPGRSFGVEEQQPKNLIQDIQRMVKEKRNTLVFQPGKQEIELTIKTLQDLNLHAEIFPLHGSLLPEEQAKCFESYSLPKIVVSTNVAQTSITIPDIDAVLDTGLERRIELADGIEGLYLRPISLSDRAQRKGRAGRVKPGIFIDYCTEKKRPQHPTAEILRTRLDQTVLRLAESGFDIEELPFFHQPKLSEIKKAKETLKALGCLNNNGDVTKLGQDVALLPINVRYARMIIEADKRGVVSDIVTIASLFEAGSITDRKNLAWRRIIRGERFSDAIAQAKLFDLAAKMTPEEREENGIYEKAYLRAVEIRDHLTEIVRSRVSRFDSSGNRQDIILSIISGMVDNLYVFNDGTYFNKSNSEETFGDERILARESIIKNGADWIVGMPFDLHIDSVRGNTVLNLIHMVTIVNPYDVTQFAPHLIKKENKTKTKYSFKRDKCLSLTKIIFNDMELESKWRANLTPDEKSSIFARWLAKEILEKKAPRPDVKFNRLLLFARKNLENYKSILDRKRLAKILLARLDGISNRADAMLKEDVFRKPF